MVLIFWQEYPSLLHSRSSENTPVDFLYNLHIECRCLVGWVQYVAKELTDTFQS